MPNALRGHEEDRLDHSRAPVYTCVELRGFTSAANLGSRCRPFPRTDGAVREPRSGSQVLYRKYEENGKQGNGESGNKCAPSYGRRSFAASKNTTLAATSETSVLL